MKSQRSTIQVMSTALFVALAVLLGAGGIAPAHAGFFPSPPSAQLTLEKLVDGDPADVGPGPEILVPGTVTFTYLVGMVGILGLFDTITNVSVIDDNGTPGNFGDDFIPTFVGGDTVDNDQLDPFEIWTFTATRAAVLGDHENIGSVTARFGGGVFTILGPVTDLGHYRGISAASVPEPSTLALLGAGLIALGYLRRGRS